VRPSALISVRRAPRRRLGIVVAVAAIATGCGGVSPESLAVGTWSCSGPGEATAYIASGGRWAAEVDAGYYMDFFEGTWALENRDVRITQDSDRGEYEVTDISTEVGAAMEVSGNELTLADVELTGSERVAVTLSELSEKFDCERTSKTNPDPFPTYETHGPPDEDFDYGFASDHDDDDW
jgi:hypothetical protein